MNTQDFLNLVLPSSGYYLILIPKKTIDRTTGKEINYYKHFAFTTIADAAQHAVALATDQRAPQNVYFALGSVREDLTHMSKAQRDQLKKKTRGVHKDGYDNTWGLRSFWLDLDVDPAKVPHTYATRDEAALGLRDFCQVMGLPRPYVTSSGGGFHVYWPLDRDLHPDDWQVSASILKQLAESHGLRADRSRTADRASILRPVGTFNWKTGQPRSVDVVVTGSVVNADQFLARLKFLADSAGLQPVVPRAPQPALTLGGAAANYGDSHATVEQATAGVGYEPVDPREMVQRCQQLAWQAANQALVPEPLWYAMIGCVRHAQDGRRAVHFMSRQSPDYDPADTDAKITQHENNGIGPTTCATFASHNPSGCEGCPYKGKITTPLQTVRQLKQVAPPTLQLVAPSGAVQQLQLPNPPKPFKRVHNPATGTARIAWTIGDAKTGNEQDQVIYEYDLYPSRLIFDERENRYTVVVNRWLPQDGWHEFEIPTGKLYDRKQLAMTFGDMGVWPDVAMVEPLVQYMIAYIRDLQKQAQSTVLYAQLGWRDDHAKFILPNKVVTPIGYEPISPSANVANTLSWKDPKGDLEVWKKMAAVYERPGMEAHQFGFGVGFASPLFVFTNFTGMIVSMVGKRGAGKSSSVMMANSIYGHPKMGWADLQHDTMRAFYQKLGVLKNLPATYDEHTNLDGETISDMCYLVSKGQGRQRLTTSGQAQENHGSFQLMMLMTGNTSLNSRLAQVKADTSAESARVFEYTVPENTLTKDEADLYWGPGGQLFDHFGLAGDIYTRQLLISHEWAQNRVKEWVRDIDKAGNVSSGERFWSAGVACVLTGFELANACGLTNCDIDRLAKFAIRVIHEMRGTVGENTRSPVNVIADYFNANLRGVLILGSEASGATAAQMIHEPSDRLRIRLERHTGRMYIDRAMFRRYCGDQSVDANDLAKELLNMGVLISKDQRMTLGKGTPYNGIQSPCWVVDMKHPDVIGLGELTSVPSAPVVQLAAVK